MELLKDTVDVNYPELIAVFDEIKEINWNRVYAQKSSSRNVKRRKKQSLNKALSQDETSFLVLQKRMVVLGTYINEDPCPIDEILRISIQAKNYDELISSIKWVDKDKIVDFFRDVDNLCKSAFPCLYDFRGEYTIRDNIRRLFYETMLDLDIEDVNKEMIQIVANDIETSMLIYSLLIVIEGENFGGDFGGITWNSNLLRSVYNTKCNCVLACMSNKEYNRDFLSVLLDETNTDIIPIEVAFLKRSQLLSRRFEDLETNKLKIFEESGLSQNDEDYTIHKSRVKCPQCHLNHTSFTEKQTRSADEPMTIFWYCYKCKIRGRQ